MNNKIKLLSIIGFSALALNVSAADEDQTVRVVAKNAEGDPLAVVPVNLESKIRFTSDKVEFYDGETMKNGFPYSSFSTLSFLTPGTGVSSVKTQSPFGLAENPVGDTLRVKGYEGTPVPLVIAGLGGDVKLRISAWGGDPVDVSSLLPGLYFVTVNRTTLKFIKK